MSEEDGPSERANRERLNKGGNQLKKGRGEQWKRNSKTKNAEIETGRV